MASQSPLKAKPLRNPGQGIDKKIEETVTDAVFAYFLATAIFSAMACMEWVGYLTQAPRRPVLLSVVAGMAGVVGAWRIWRVRDRVRALKLGRDGERCVGQFLERLREGGAQVFHDVPGNHFNLDHVIISPHGIYAVETKTLSKPWPKATILVDEDVIQVAGRKPDRDPVVQVTAAARWLEATLAESTGKRFAVRGVVVYPGWFVEQRSDFGSVWVLEPKMLPGFIEREPKSLAPTDVALAAFHLSRYVRSEAEKAA